jgi:hydroxymethylpyrimidine kinase/phosphomethylpyrimidine kinase
MLASAATIEIVAKALETHSLTKVVLDPVMISTSGAQLLPPEAVSNLRTMLLRHSILTPNIPEAKLLLSDAGIATKEIESVVDMETMAQTIQQELGPAWVLVKGGHVPLKPDLTVAKMLEERRVMVNVLYGNGQFYHIQSDFQDSRNTHGTGCSLACECLYFGLAMDIS